MPRHGEMRGRSGDAAEVRLVCSVRLAIQKARIRGREGAGDCDSGDCGFWRGIFL